MPYYHSRYSKPKKKKWTLLKKAIVVFIILLVISTACFGYMFWLIFYKSNVWTYNGASESIYIPTGANFDQASGLLYEHGSIINRSTFEWLAKRKKYDKHIKPGRYLLYDGMSNLEVINILNGGLQTPIKLIFNYVRTKEELTGKISQQIEADSVSIINLLNDSTFLKQFGMTPKKVMMMFIPNTYEFYWNTDAEVFLNRMYKEYNRFWNENRITKIKQLDLTRSEVVILASIVDRETLKNEEKPVIAGVYINRLKKNWRLQADPTVVYAVGDFSLKRVLKSHTEIDSPYNTYLIQGLPPGPICLPSIASIDAVLNYEDHEYLYFCAREDFSGYHNFAKTYLQHKRNARRFQNALNNLNIK